MKRIVLLLTLCLGISGIQTFGGPDNGPILGYMFESGRFMVYDLALRGTGLEVLEGRGISTYNRESQVFDSVRIARSSAVGILVEDHYANMKIFIMPYRGGYDIWYASVNPYYAMVTNRERMTETDTRFRAGASGVRAFKLYLNGDDVELECAILGTWTSSMNYRRLIDEKALAQQRLYMDDVNLSVSFVGAGSGIGYEQISSTNAMFEGSLIGIPTAEVDQVEATPAEYQDSLITINSVRTRYNRKFSAALSTAYESGTNEVAGIEAASAVVNRYLNKRAKIRDADFMFEFDD